MLAFLTTFKKITPLFFKEFKFDNQLPRLQALLPAPRSSQNRDKQDKKPQFPHLHWQKPNEI